MIIKVTKGEYAVVKRVLDEAYMLDEKHFLLPSLLPPLLAAAAVCNPFAKINSTLGHIETVDGNGTSLYNQYNTSKSDSKSEQRECLKRKLLFATIMQCAQQKNIPIAKAATIVKNELSAGNDSYNQLTSSCIKSLIKIGTIVTTTDQSGEEIVIVNFRFNDASRNSGKIKMNSSEIVIPTSVTFEH